MKARDFYKVANAVIHTLMEGDSVAYVTCGQGGSGSGLFVPNDNLDVIRRDLLSYDNCEEIDKDELADDWSKPDDGMEFWELSMYGGQNPASIQIAINPDNYVTSSYKLCDMICEEQELKAAEITTGMNGYPRGLRGCVLIGDTGKTFEEMEEIANLYGVEVVSLHRRDGWQLWEYEGTAFGLYDFADFMSNHNDNLHWWSSYQDYADELRDYAETEDNQEWRELADSVENNTLGKNEFLYCSQGFPDLEDPDVADRMVGHFSYDTHNYMLALDCMIND